MAREAWCKGKHASMHAYQEGKFCFDEISRVFSSKSISFTKKKKKIVGILQFIRIQITIYLKQYKNKFVFTKKNWLSMQSRI